MRPSSLENYLLVASNLGLDPSAWLHLLRKTASVDHFYHLTAPLDRLRFPRLRSDIHLHGATEDDLGEIVRGIPDLDPASRKEVLARILFYRSGFTGCYVGRGHRNEVVSMQWLIRPSDNPLIERRCRRRFHPLKDKHVLIENIFIFPAFRALGVFPTVNHLVLEIAKEEGFQVCNAYVRKDNIASLNGYLGLGFQLRKLLTSYSLAGFSWRRL
jgi:ribosomal protein S18 acetylase RimI-like enzyme